MKRLNSAVCLALAFVFSVNCVGSFAASPFESGSLHNLDCTVVVDPAYPREKSSEDHNKELTVKKIKTEKTPYEICSEYLNENMDRSTFAGWTYSLGDTQNIYVYCTDEEKAKKVMKNLPQKEIFEIHYLPAKYSYNDLVPYMNEIEKLIPSFIGKENMGKTGFPETPYMNLSVTEKGIEIHINGNCDNSKIIEWFKNYKHRNLATLKIEYPMWNPA